MIMGDTVLLQIFARVKTLRFSQFEPNFNILRSYFCDRGCYPQKLVYRSLTHGSDRKQ